MDVKEVRKIGVNKFPPPSLSPVSVDDCLTNASEKDFRLAATSDARRRPDLKFPAQDRGDTASVYTKGDTASVYPKKHYRCGFDITGRQKWYLELTNGRLVSSKDENYIFWLKKFSINEKQTFLERKTRRNEIPPAKK